MLVAGDDCGGGEKLNKTQNILVRHPATTPNLGLYNMTLDKEIKLIDGGVSWQNIPNCGCLQLYFEKSCVILLCAS